MSLPLKSERSASAPGEPLVEQLISLMQRPEFGSVLAKSLRATPEFATLFAEMLGRAVSVPAFADVLAQSVVNAQVFLPGLAPGYGTAPFRPLFPGDESAKPPITYSRMRAAETWSRTFGTVMDFVQASQLEGDIYEFGTFEGYTARHFALAMTAKNRPESTRLHLFDTFSGFPEFTSAVDQSSYEVHWEAGACAAAPGTADNVRRMLRTLLSEDRFTINVGTFADTLVPAAVERPAAVIHVDCDLYESAKVVLDRMLEFGKIQDGTVLIFDDFNCARGNPEFGERRAMHETFDAHPHFSCEPWFPYGWHGQVCIAHERGIARKRGAV
jgi:hypothetical protein